VTKRAVVVLGRDISDDVWGIVSTIFVGGGAWATSVVASLKFEQYFYSNVLALATVCLLALRGGKILIDLWMRTDSEAARKQKESLEDALREMRAEDSRHNKLQAQLDDEIAALRAERKQMEEQKKALKVAKWLVSSSEQGEK
jgi:uncharacterized membrane protein